MSKIHYSTALIVGAGFGISASLARLFAQRGLKVAVAARDAAKLGPLAAEIGGAAFATDAGDAVQVKQLFEDVARTVGEPDVVVYNASGRVRGRSSISIRPRSRAPSISPRSVASWSARKPPGACLPGRWRCAARSCSPAPRRA